MELKVTSMNIVLKFSLCLSLSISSIAGASRLPLSETEERQKRVSSIDLLHEIVLRERAREENPRPAVIRTRKRSDQEITISKEDRARKRRDEKYVSGLIMKSRSTFTGEALGKDDVSVVKQDLRITLSEPKKAQKKSVVIDLEDEEGLVRALNQYNPERQRNRIQEAYMNWFGKLNEMSGLKFASKKERYLEELYPDNELEKANVQVEIRWARENLRWLASCMPIHTILVRKGFTHEEITDARETLFLNFYDQ